MKSRSIFKDLENFVRSQMIIYLTVCDSIFTAPLKVMFEEGLDEVLFSASVLFERK